jgi:hypothetical protein
LREDALVFFWEDAGKDNEARAGGAVRTFRVEARETARFGRDHGMDLAGGSFVAEGLGETAHDLFRRSGAFTFEAIVTPEPGTRDRKGGKIVSLGENFVLRDSREDLRLFLRTSDAPDGRDGDEERESVLGALPGGRPTHVIVSYRPGVLAYYANGKEVLRSTIVRGDLRGFGPGPLRFGAGPRDKKPWHGSLAAVALYARFVDAAEAADRHAALAGRLGRPPAAPPIPARGRLVALTPVPDPASIAPYRRALVVASYEIEEGPPELRGKRVPVATWGILDGRVVSSTARLETGRTRALRLEPFAARPELESERLLDDSNSVEQALWLDVAPIDRRALEPPRAQGQVAEER